MPFARQVTVDGEAVPGLFEKIPTEGDIHRFASAETGKSQIVGLSDTSGILTWGSDFVDVQLDFNFLMGVKQLEVGIVDPVTGKIEAIPSLTTINDAIVRSGSNFPSTFDPSEAALLYFDEVDTDVVRVYHVSSSDIIRFRVPHTSTPAETSQKVIVLRQGDQVAVELLGEGDGVLLKAPNGRRGLLRMDNNLKLTVLPR
jgi:hypothetical protein